MILNYNIFPFKNPKIYFLNFSIQKSKNIYLEIFPFKNSKIFILNLENSGGPRNSQYIKGGGVDGPSKTLSLNFSIQKYKNIKFALIQFWGGGGGPVKANLKTSWLDHLNFRIENFYIEKNQTIAFHIFMEKF